MPQDLTTELKSVSDTIRDRIRAEFCRLVPDERWDAFVQAEIDAFTKPTTSGDRWDRRPAPIQAIIYDALVAVAKDKIKAELDSGRWQAKFDGTQMAVGDAIAELVKSHGDEIMKTMMASTMRMIAESALQAFRTQLMSAPRF